MLGFITSMLIGDVLMRIRWLIRITFLFLFGLLIGWCNTTTGHAATKTYVIGTDVTYPPFEFANQKNRYVGIDIDLMKAIAKQEGFKVKIKPLAFNSAIQALESGQIDGLIAGLTITPARRVKFDFSTPYYKTGTIMAVAKGSKVHSLKQLRGKRVAIKTGTAGATYANSIKQKYGFKTVTFDDSDNMYQDVVTGNSVACFEDQPVMQYSIQQGMKLKIVTQPTENGNYGFAVKRGQNQALLKAFNRGLRTLQHNGQFATIKQHYLGSSQQKKSAQAQKTSRSWAALLKQNQQALWHGFQTTILLTIFGIVCATLFGLLIGLLGVIPSKITQASSNVVIYFFRGLPLLVLALFIYTGIPSLTGHKISALVAGILTLTLDEGAYVAAFVRGGIEAVDPGQMEAARSLGVTYGRSLLKVILPQGVRLMIPSFINQFIITLKDTSILSVIGLLELTQTGKVIIARNLEGFKIWTMIAVIYITMITLLTWLSNFVQKRLKV